MKELFSKTLEDFDKKKKRGCDHFVGKWRGKLKELLNQCNIALEVG